MSGKLVLVILIVLAVVLLVGTTVGGMRSCNEADDDKDKPAEPQDWMKPIEDLLVDDEPLDLQDVRTTCLRCNGRYCVDGGRRCTVTIVAREGPYRAATVALDGSPKVTIEYETKGEYAVTSEMELDPEGEDEDRADLRIGEEGAVLTVICRGTADCRIAVTPTEQD